MGNINFLKKTQTIKIGKVLLLQKFKIQRNLLKKHQLFWKKLILILFSKNGVNFLSKSLIIKLVLLIKISIFLKKINLILLIKPKINLIQQKIKFWKSTIMISNLVYKLKEYWIPESIIKMIKILNKKKIFLKWELNRIWKFQNSNLIEWNSISLRTLNEVWLETVNII